MLLFKESLEKPAVESGESLVDELSKLHIRDGLSAALDPSDNGYFDLLPVSKGTIINHLGGAWCKLKKKMFGGIKGTNKISY